MSNEHNQIFQILQAAMDNEPEMADEDRDIWGMYGGSMDDAFDGGYRRGYTKGQADLAKQITKLISQWDQTNSNNLSNSR